MSSSCLPFGATTYAYLLPIRRTEDTRLLVLRSTRNRGETQALMHMRPKSLATPISASLESSAQQLGSLKDPRPVGRAQRLGPAATVQSFTA
jgi:hypothetical protein